jgi:Ca2+/Na+ antiporter
MRLALRFFAFLFNSVLSLSLFLLALLVMASGRHNIQLAPAPLTGRPLTYTILFTAISGFVFMVLALRKSRTGRAPMVLWNLMVLALLISTPLRGTFAFKDRGEAATVLYLTLAALLAFWGSWLQWRAKRARWPG